MTCSGATSNDGGLHHAGNFVDDLLDIAATIVIMKNGARMLIVPILTPQFPVEKRQRLIDDAEPHRDVVDHAFTAEQHDPAMGAQQMVAYRPDPH